MWTFIKNNRVFYYPVHNSSILRIIQEPQFCLKLIIAPGDGEMDDLCCFTLQIQN